MAVERKGRSAYRAGHDSGAKDRGGIVTPPTRLVDTWSDGGTVPACSSLSSEAVHLCNSRNTFGHFISSRTVFAM